MTRRLEFYAQNELPMAQQTSQQKPAQNEPPTPPIGDTPPEVLAREAADGHRGAAWRLMLWILDNDPRAVISVSSLDDDRLAHHLLEFIALGTWSGKPFVVPVPLRSAYARTRLRTLFLPGAAIDASRAKRVVLEALRDPRPQMRETAIYVLSLIGGKEDCATLITALHDPSHLVRYQAVKALGSIGDATAIPALFGALRHADEHLGSQIFLSLTHIGRASVPALIERSASSSAWIRWHCIRTLGELNDSRAVPTLAQALNDPDHGVAWMAAKELVQFGPLAIDPTLHVLMNAETSPWLVETASYVLSTITRYYHELKPYLDPVIRMLHGTAFRVSTPIAARKSLEQLDHDQILQKALSRS